VKLLRVTLRVRDQQEALHFYTEKLGFVIQADFPYGQEQRWITVAPADEPGVQIVLQPPEWFSGEERAQHLLYAGHNPTLVFQVEDCKAIHERLEKNGVKFPLPPTEHDYGIEADATDMDGNTLVFLQLKNAVINTPGVTSQ
jgi:catechol 2,3-dioxygenase-like lactoylglutathione lyase family enzyme